MRGLFPRLLLITTLLYACPPSIRAGEPEPLEPAGPFHPGFASVPWHAASSPDGRWLAIVESHPVKYVAVFDARTRRQVWRRRTEASPATHRPAFTRDGERLVLIEGDSLAVRTRKGETWPVTGRVGLGFRPGVTSRSRAIVLSPDESLAWFVEDDRLHEVSLQGPTPGVRTRKPENVSAVHFTRNRLAVSRQTDTLAETKLFPPDADEPEEVLPFAIVAASPEGRTWLVDRGSPRLELVDAGTHAMLGAVPLAKHARLSRHHLTAAEFSPDGQFLVTVESLFTGSVRDARTGRLLQRLRQYEEDRMIGVVWSADGRFLVTSGRRDGDAVLLWRLRESRAQGRWHERLRTALFERTAPNGTLWGRDRLDPLLNPSTTHLLEGDSHQKALTVLDRLLEHEKPSPLERALIQRDLWAVFDWVVGLEAKEGKDARESLAHRLAAAIAHVSLTDAEIDGLPNGLAAELPELPRDLLAERGLWICLGDEKGKFLTPFHLQSRRGRSAFTVHVRFPGGRAPAEAWIESVRKILAPLGGESLVPAARALPDPPSGTRFVLLRHALLVNREGRLRKSNLVERVQMRVHGKEDSFFEWNLDARHLLDGEGAALVPVGETERGFAFFEEGHGGDLFEAGWMRFERLGPRSTVLATCASCHARHFMSHRIQSVTHSVGPIGPLPTGLKPSTAARETGLFVDWKRKRAEFVRLLRAFE